eukprot:3662852-Rhodomonas_salina.1
MEMEMEMERERERERESVRSVLIHTPLLSNPSLSRLALATFAHTRGGGAPEASSLCSWDSVVRAPMAPHEIVSAVYCSAEKHTVSAEKQREGARGREEEGEGARRGSEGVRERGEREG